MEAEVSEGITEPSQSLELVEKSGEAVQRKSVEFGKSERVLRDSLRDIEALQSRLLTAHFLHIFSVIAPNLSLPC